MLILMVLLTFFYGYLSVRKIINVRSESEYYINQSVHYDYFEMYLATIKNL